MIGLISDTHGMLRKEVLESLKDCKLILHAGDIGKPEVIDNLKDISNIEFIRGNCDKDKNIAKEDKVVDIYNKRKYLIHDISKIDIDLKKENIDIVVYGHSHKSNIYEANQILYINPGSVGPRRFKLPISMAKLRVLKNEKYYNSLELVYENTYRYKDLEIEFIYIGI